MSSLSSPFTTVLDTNYSPSSTERGKISSLLKGSERRIRALEEEISKLQTERDELQSFVDRHRALLSPIRRLSVEILGEIFVHTLPKSVFNLGGKLKDAPLILTVVSRLWRETALNTPELWNDIHIHLPRYSEYTPLDQFSSHIMRRKEGIKSWIDRSGSLPLTIIITVGFHPVLGSATREDVPVLKEVTKLCTTYSHRWRTVIFGGNVGRKGSLILEPFAELTREELPWLRNFRAKGSLFESHYPEPRLKAGPLARLLEKPDPIRTLCATYDPPLLEPLRVHWDSLQELELVSGKEDPALIVSKVAGLCPLLRSFNLQVQLDSRPLSGSPPPTYWPHLRTIDVMLSIDEAPSLDAAVSQGFLRVFQRMRAPVLNDLFVQAKTSGPKIRNLHDDEQTFLSVSSLPFHDMISESGRSISHLALDGMFLLNEQALTRSLERLHSLTSLKIMECAGGKYGRSVPPLKVATCLVFLASSPEVCPNLAELDVIRCGVDSISPIVSLVTARSNKLKCLSIDFGVVPPELAAEIESSIPPDLGKDGGVTIDWKWKEHKAGTEPYPDHPYSWFTQLQRPHAET
ncbi:hypothetical protein V5O48_004828 [Marasmius crinis-equi]|uniref:F-box domain-containing protein n=1 Tax=Marasmius crinis-equi TaxID=585013 RepID=A0ABR3FP21_9AGAR